MSDPEPNHAGVLLQEPPRADARDESPSVLLVDDDESVITVVRRFLEPRGMRVTSAADGLEGLGLFRERRFDVLVTDIMMPGMGGWELITAVHEEDPRLPIVIITGFAGSGAEWSEESLARRGVVALYLKPINFVLFRTHLERLCLASKH